MLITKINLNTLVSYSKCYQDLEKLQKRKMAVFLFNLKYTFLFSTENIHYHPKSHKMDYTSLLIAVSKVKTPKAMCTSASDFTFTHYLCSLQRCFQQSERKSFIVGFSPPSDRAQKAVSSLICHRLYIKDCEDTSNNLAELSHHLGYFPI